MTGAARAVWGAAIGALITLFIHPVSRAYLLSNFVMPGTPRPVAVKNTLPSDKAELASWLVAAADRQLAHEPLTNAELRTAISVASKGYDLDSQNAFWPQMLATLESLNGNRQAALQHWYKASALPLWNDYQSSVLFAQREDLAHSFGSPQSWQLAYLYYQRSEAPAALIAAFARSLLNTASVSEKSDLTLRGACVQNGWLMFMGSRSVRVGEHGAQVAELASHPPGMFSSVSAHKLLLARVNLYNKLRDQDETSLAGKVNHAYRELDAWDAFVSTAGAAEQASELTTEGLLLACLPGSFIVIAIVGVAFWGLSGLFKGVERIAIVPATTAGMGFAVGTYAVTLLPLAALAAFGCCVCLAFAAKNERTWKSGELGPLFNFVVGALALSFIAVAVAFLLGLSTPANSLLPMIGAPSEYFGGSAVLLALAILLLALLLLLAPFYALAMRLSTGFVLGVALRRFGIVLTSVAFIFVIFGTPICIYEDRNVSRVMQQLLLNEPVYYYSLPR